MDAAISTHGLTKQYSGRRAVEDLTWEVPRGAACALLGPNAAGKSTAIRMLMGFTPPSAGSCEVLGEDPWEMGPGTRARIGYVSEQPILPPWMRVAKLCALHRSLHPRWDAREETRLRDLFGIGGDALVGNLSKGQHRRLMVLLALCACPDVLILDEPAAGLDVAARRELLTLLGAYLAEGDRTVLVSSHIVTDVERIASHVAIMDGARLVEYAPLDTLHEDVKTLRLPREGFDPRAPAWEEAGVIAAEANGSAAVVTVRHFTRAAASLRRHAGGRDLEVIDVSLEDIFLAVTRRTVAGVA